MFFALIGTFNTQKMSYVIRVCHVLTHGGDFIFLEMDLLNSVSLRSILVYLSLL